MDNMELSGKVYDEISKKIKEKIDENNRSAYQNFNFKLEIGDDGNGHNLFIEGWMNIILYLSKDNKQIINVVPVWWDMKVVEKDNVDIWDIEWEQIKERLVEEV